jgi:hypothetical protein
VSNELLRRIGTTFIKYAMNSRKVCYPLIAAAASFEPWSSVRGFINANQGRVDNEPFARHLSSQNNTEQYSTRADSQRPCAPPRLTQVGLPRAWLYRTHPTLCYLCLASPPVLLVITRVPTLSKDVLLLVTLTKEKILWFLRMPQYELLLTNTYKFIAWMFSSAFRKDA